MGSTERTYICIDLKSFYASVECVERGLDPLKARLVVADESRTDKTICLAVTPALKAYGVPGRPRLFEVNQILDTIRRTTGRKIDFIIAPPRMQKYIDVSSSIYSVYLDYIAPEDIHVYSIDEVFMDVSDYLKLYKTDAHNLAVTMIRDVLKKTGITATAGIGTNLYLAKIAMDIVAKHMPADKDGVRIAELDERSYCDLLWDHKPLTDFWRIGHGTASRLGSYGIHTMGDIARQSLKDEEFLYKLFGIDAEILIDHAWGKEPCTMKDIKSYRPTYRSLSSGQVLASDYPYEKALIVIKEMAFDLALDMVSKHLVTSALTIDVGYAAIDLANTSYTGPVRMNHYGKTVPKSAHGSVNLGVWSSSPERISDATASLFSTICDHSLKARRLNITANNIIDESMSGKQLDIFDYAEEAESRRLASAIVDLRERFGKNAVIKVLDLKDGATAIDRNRQIGGHRA